MREIKFRGKCSQSKRWVYGWLLTNKLGTYIVTEENPHECTQNHYIEIDEYCRVVPESVGQYTGLKDKGGTESYHKDIVRTNAEQVGVVEFGSYSPTGNEWDNTWGWFIQFPNGGQISMDEHFRCWGEVVGNIYDNPELLEGDE